MSNWPPEEWTEWDDLGDKEADGYYDDVIYGDPGLGMMNFYGLDYVNG